MNIITKLNKNPKLKIILGLLFVIILLYFLLITFLNNRVTTEDQAYITWYHQHKERFNSVDEVISQTEDDYKAYMNETSYFERGNSGVIPSDIAVAFEEISVLRQEVIDHPMPSNLKLRKAHKLYEQAMKDYSRYASSLLEQIESNGGVEDQLNVLSSSSSSRSRLFEVGTLVYEIEFK